MVWENPALQAPCNSLHRRNTGAKSPARAARAARAAYDPAQSRLLKPTTWAYNPVRRQQGFPAFAVTEQLLSTRTCQRDAASQRRLQFRAPLNRFVVSVWS